METVIFWRNYALYSYAIFNIMDKVFFFTSYGNVSNIEEE